MQMMWRLQPRCEAAIGLPPFMDLVCLAVKGRRVEQLFVGLSDLQQIIFQISADRPSTCAAPCVLRALQAPPLPGAGLEELGNKAGQGHM